MKLTKNQAKEILEVITNQEDPYWDDIIEQWIIENDVNIGSFDWPTIDNLYEALGIIK